MLTLLLLGLFAGALTTVAGLGGGQLLVLALAALFDPRLALVTSAPALLIGNLHRAALYRRHLDLRTAGRFIAGALPGSLLGGLIAVQLPLWMIRALLVTMTLLALLRALGLLRLRPPKSAVFPAGLFIGTMCAASAGAGLLTAPVLLASGLSGAAYVATSALCAASMHLGRIGGYSLGGLLTVSVLSRSAILCVAILAGNLLGDRLRRRLSPRQESWIEHGTMLACALLALLGIG